MSKLKITQGEWKIHGESMLKDPFGWYHEFKTEQERDAFKDFVDTHQKCGLLPSELLEKNQELREALQTLIRVTKNYKVGINNDILYRVENKTYKMSEKALTKEK